MNWLLDWLRWLVAPWTERRRAQRQLWDYVLIQTEHITALAERVAALEERNRKT